MFRRLSSFIVAGGVLAAIATVCLGLPSTGTAAEEARQLKIHREIHSAGADGYPLLIINIDATAEMSNGKLKGSGVVDSTLCVSVRIEEVAHHPFTFEGTYSVSPDDPSRIEVRFRFPGKFQYTCVKAPPKCEPGSFCVGQLWEYNWTKPDDWDFFGFHMTIVDGRFEDSKQIAPVGQPIDVKTLLEITGGKIEGDILVFAEHPAIPGHSDITNEIQFTLPKSPALANKRPLNVQVSVGSGGSGGLAKTKEAAVRGRVQRTLELANVTPGSTHRVFYAWRGAIRPDFAETVKVKVANTDVTGSTSFDVGLDAEVTGFSPFIAKEPKTREIQPFRITVARSGGKTPSLQELAEKFGLEFELDLKRSHFQPATSVEQLISDLSFNAGDWVEALSQQGASLDAAATGKTPGSLYGGGLLWKVGPDGRLWDPSEASAEQRLPNYLPFQRGVHMFKAHVAAIVHGTERLANPTQTPRGYTLDVEMKDPAQAFFDQIVFGCAGETLQAVTDEIKDLEELNPTALAGVEVDAVGLLWSCIKIGLDTELADEFLSEHILLNTLVMTVLQTEQDVQALLAQAEEVMKPSAKDFKGERLVLVESPNKVTSVATGDGKTLTEAQAPRDELAKARTTKGAGTTRADIDRARLQSKGNRTAFYARPGEMISVHLPASARQARLFVVTPEGAHEGNANHGPGNGRDHLPHGRHCRQWQHPGRPQDSYSQTDSRVPRPAQEPVHRAEAAPDHRRSMRICGLPRHLQDHHDPQNRGVDGAGEDRWRPRL